MEAFQTNARLLQKVSDVLDDLYDNLEYNFGKLMKPSEIYENLRIGFGTDIADGYKEWWEQGDDTWR